MMTILLRCGGRRFVMTMGAGIVDTLLLIGGHLSGEQYVTVTIATIGAFITANTWQQIKTGEPE